MTKSPKFLAAIFAGILAFGGAGGAMASAHYPQGYQSSFDTIKAIHGGTVTLMDDTSYAAPFGFDMSALKVGERVQISWRDDGGSRVASTIILG